MTESYAKKKCGVVQREWKGTGQVIFCISQAILKGLCQDPLLTVVCLSHKETVAFLAFISPPSRVYELWETEQNADNLGFFYA